MQIIGLRM